MGTPTNPLSEYSHKLAELSIMPKFIYIAGLRQTHNLTVTVEYSNLTFHDAQDLTNKLRAIFGRSMI